MATDRKRKMPPVQIVPLYGAPFVDETVALSRESIERAIAAVQNEPADCPQQPPIAPNLAEAINTICEHNKRAAADDDEPTFSNTMTSLLTSESFDRLMATAAAMERGLPLTTRPDGPGQGVPILPPDEARRRWREEDRELFGYGLALPPRDIEAALREVRECLERQLPQGIENAARHIVACLDEFGRGDTDAR